MEEQCECNVGLTREEVAVLKSDHRKILFSLFGEREDGTSTDEGGLVGLTQRREAQLSLLLWIFGPSSILSVILSALALFRH